ncbi:hypothetical protein JTB14_006607 [Gonioctena quinquepunctata]|nr:hypothetical protein JTB14_006607 [Gonioctena quinquepunctata]
MGNLPAQRINMAKPFSYVGGDYGGPFHITMGKGKGIKSQKAYICLFICFATKAIHIELASDLSSDAFIAALRRFISRRGRCSCIFCDRETNFVGAQKVPSEFMKEAAEAERIYFSFSASGSPQPLSALSSDADDFTALTPGHFLTLEPLTSLPNPDLTHLKSNTDRRQLPQNFQQNISNRWSSE